jgi:hypothetical protein
MQEIVLSPLATWYTFTASLESEGEYETKHTCFLSRGV